MTSTLAPTRRDVLRIAGAVTLASSAVTGTAALAQNETGRGLVKAVGFDAFTIFDPRSVDAAVEDIYPGKGKEAGGGLAHPFVRIYLALHAQPDIRRFPGRSPKMSQFVLEDGKHRT